MPQLHREVVQVVKIPTYESQTVAKAPISRNRPLIADSGAAEVYATAAKAAEVAGEVIKKHKAIKNDKDLLAAMKKYKVGDMDNNQPGENQMIITASTSDDFEMALPSYNEAATAWQQKVAEGISNGQVRDKFLIKSGESLLSGYLNVERSVFANNRTSYQETIKDDATNTVNNYVEAFLAKDTLGLSQAGAKLFGTVDNQGVIKDFSFGQRLKDRGMLPEGTTAEQYDENMKVAMLNTLAVSLIENNPAEFINLEAKDFFNLIDPGKLVEYNAKAKDSYTNKTIVSLLDFLPLDADRSDEETEALFIAANSGVFGDDTAKKNMFDSLDAEGQLKFRNALSSRRQQIKAEITWKRNNDIFAEQQANKASYETSYQGIISSNEDGTQFGIADIENQTWVGAEGTRLKESLIGLVVKREEGNLPTDAGLAMYDAIWNKTINKEIKSVTEPFLLKGETEAKSILDRVGQDGIGTNQFNILNANVNNRNNSDIIYAENEFSNFVEAYRDQILGSEAYKKFNSKGDARYLDFTLIMRERYNKGIAAGKTPMDLLLSSSSDYILGDLPEFVPSQKELMEEIKESMLGTTSTTDLTLQEWLDAAPQKPADMSFEDFKLTQEYLDYQATKPQ